MKLKHALLAAALAVAPLALATSSPAVVVAIGVRPGHHCWHHHCYRYAWHGGYYDYYWHGRYWKGRWRCHRHWCYR